MDLSGEATALRNGGHEVMGTYLGGSAPAMAKQICDGYTLLSPVMLKRLDVGQMKKLEFVMDKKLRETRGEAMDLSDQEAVQARNRRIARIENALRLLRQTIQQQRRSGPG
jgi:hypothetical protein